MRPNRSAGKGKALRGWRESAPTFTYRAMLMRLILALLVACLSLPAVAAAPACDTGPAAMADMDHHAPEPDRDATAPHQCIGCAPLPDLAPRAAAPVPHAEPQLTSAAPTLSVGGGIPPALPPPRIG